MWSGRAPEAVLGALRLAAGENALSLSALVHVIPFLTGERRACRLVLDRRVADSLGEHLRELRVNVRRVPVVMRELGPDWWEFGPGPMASDHALLAMASDERRAEEIIAAEFEGRFQDSGRLLGYPSCCVAAYRAVSERHRYWPSYYLDQEFVVSPWCNRLVYLWGGSCPTGELFPCSLTCTHAIKLGKKNMAALENVGLARLRDLIWQMAAGPLCATAAGEVKRGLPAGSGDQLISIRH